MSLAHSLTKSVVDLPPQFTDIKLTVEQNLIIFCLSFTKSYKAPFSSSKSISALKSCFNACEGHDGIPNVMFQNLPPLSLAFLPAVFNRICMNGIPQGYVLSTILFLTAINDIISSLPISVRSALYVDDFAISTTGS